VCVEGGIADKGCAAFRRGQDVEIVEVGRVDGIVVEFQAFDVTHVDAVEHGVDDPIAADRNTGIGGVRTGSTGAYGRILVSIAVASTAQDQVALNLRAFDGIARCGEGTDVDPAILDGIRQQVVGYQTVHPAVEPDVIGPLRSDYGVVEQHG